MLVERFGGSPIVAGSLGSAYLHLAPGGVSSCVIDGTELAGAVHAVMLSSAPRELPELVLHLMPDVEVDLPACVIYATPAGLAGASDAAEAVAALSPDAIEGALVRGRMRDGVAAAYRDAIVKLLAGTE